MKTNKVIIRVDMAPFETFYEHSVREASGIPYNKDFIDRCRKHALEYDKLDAVLRPSLLRDLKRCVPMHYRSIVFDGISIFD